MKIYVRTDNDKLYSDVAELINSYSKYNIEIVKDFTYEIIEGDSLIIYDFQTAGDDDDWKNFWNKSIPFPAKLKIDNIKVIGIVAEDTDTLPMSLIDDSFFDFVKYPLYPARLKGIINKAVRDIKEEKDLISLYKIGIDLSTESNLDKLLNNILKAAMDFTDSDGGSIYLALDDIDPETGDKLMQFEQSSSDTLGEIYSKFKIPVNTSSLSGYVVATGKSLSISDVYDIHEDVPYKINSSFDKKNKYTTKSMLVVPMINHRNEIIGALQLINRKRDRAAKLLTHKDVDKYVIDYDHKCELIIRSLGSQATVSIETARLTKQLHDLFESFMNASVIAVESRDPSTAGHSRRVSKLSVAIAQHINLSSKDAFYDIDFSVNDLLSIKYAGLLHDFGKIGVNEKILLKAKKLFEEDIQIIDSRLELYKYYLFANHAYPEIDPILQSVNNLKNAIHKANEPGKIDAESAEIINKNLNDEIKLLDNTPEKILTESEYNKLVNSRGSLSNEEYEIIKSHVEHTYKFLSLIEWPTGLEKVPVIARFHHEKLDGSGYPMGLRGHMIPLESQIMCIADIFDALIASDRPYKTKMSIEKALSILQEEADQGKINQSILDLFIEDEIYNLIVE